MKHNSEQNEGISRLHDWLFKRHQEIMAAEAAAEACLITKDTDTYRKKMREKAEMLSALAHDAEPFLEGINPEQRSQIARELNRFSASAANSLKLNSVFYQSALLYNDDHKKGEPDNLQVYIAELAKN